MVLINNKWYVAPLEINSTVLLPIMLLILLIVVGIQLKNKVINRKWKADILLGIFLIYIWFLLAITLFPIPLFSFNSEIYELGFGRQVFINLRFNALKEYLPVQLIGNLLLLTPLSFFAAMYRQKFTKWLPNLGLLFLSSLTIEVLQLVMSFFYLGNSTFDINDLLLNTIGGLLGLLTFKIFSKLLHLKAKN